MDIENRYRFFVAVYVALSLMVGCTASGDEVSRTPPKVFSESVAGLLTPFEKLPGSKEHTNAQDRGGVVLLNEEVHFMGRDGRRLLAIHSIYKALNDAGAKQIEQQTIGYRKQEQKIYLAQARTIQPDGNSQPVKPDAAFLKSPQPGADSAMYDDVGEMVLIFPNVKTGAITEFTVVYEEPSFRIPGEFTFGFTWLANWPVSQMRAVIDVPEDLANRIRITTTGAGVPEFEKQILGKRARYTWYKQTIPAGPSEANRAPESQIGPALWATTLADWNAFAKWYATLLAKRDQLKPALADKVDAWTKGASNPREIADILARKAADDVRYTGLEFGNANLQPHDCNEVWENQYGDCKDKANLLRAMLAHKGIRSHLALLNTQHAGKIEKRSPDYRMFNHAILAIEGILPGGYLFCDPTIPYAKSGTFSHSDGDRELLLIKGDKGEWVHSPKQDAGELSYDFDLNLGTQGQLSGWLTQKSTGFLAAMQAWYFERLDTPSTRSQLQTMLREYYSGAELTDFEKSPVKDWNGAFQIKMHFAIPAHGNNRQLTAAFPAPQSICPHLGTTKDRLTPYFQYAEKITAHVRIKLPSGLNPQGIPQPFQTDSVGCSGKAQWRYEDGAAQGDLVIEQYAGSFSPAQFVTYSDAVASLQTWLAQPLLLSDKAEGASSQPQKAPSDALDDFPMLSNGDAQINLIEKLYPATGNPQKRYQALKKTLEYFPSDKTTRFIVTVMRANMDRQNHKAFEAVKALEVALKASTQEDLGVELYSWGEYVLALAMADSERITEAAVILERLANTPGVPQERKAWSRNFAASVLLKDSPKKAAALLLETIGQHTSAQANNIGLLSQILATTGRTKELQPVLKAFFNQESADLTTALDSLKNVVGWLVQTQKTEQAAQLLKTIDDASRDTEAAERVASALKEIRNQVSATNNAVPIQRELKSFLASSAPMEFQKLSISPGLKTREDFARAIRSEKSPDLCLRYAIELLTRFEPDTAFSYALSRTAILIGDQQQINGNTINDPLLTKLLDLCDQLPHEDENFFVGRIVRATVQRGRGNLGSARTIFETLLQDPKITESGKIAVNCGLAKTLEARGDYTQALDLYKALEASMTSPGVRDIMVRPVLLSLELGDQQEALRILGVLAALPDSKQFQPTDQYSELVALATQQKATPYWEAAAQWWPIWETFEKKAGLRPLGDKRIVMDSGEAAALFNSIEAAANRNDRRTFLELYQKLIHLARWQPTQAITACRLVQRHVYKVAPEFVADFQNISLAMLEHFVSDNAIASRWAIQLRACNYLDVGQPEKAWEITKRFIDSNPSDDLLLQDIKRFRAVAATKLHRDLAPAAASLESMLASPDFYQGRVPTVWDLVELYRLLGREEDEKALIKKELENPQIKADRNCVNFLNQRYLELQRAAITPPPNAFPLLESPGGNTPLKPVADPSTNLSQTIEKWLAKNQPSWFEFAEPKSLDDPRLRDLESALKAANGPIEPGKEGPFTVPEIVKLNLLVARAPGQSLNGRMATFEEAFKRLLPRCQTLAEARALAASVIEEPSFPEPLRIACLCHALTNAARHGNLSEAEYYAGDPLRKSLNGAGKDLAESLLAYVKTDRTSPKRIEKDCAILATAPLSPGGVEVVTLYLISLLRLGEFDRAEQLNSDIGSFQFGTQVSLSPSALQAWHQKVINEAKSNNQVHRALLALVLKDFPDPATLVKPSVVSLLQDPGQPRFLKESEMTQMLLYRIKTQQIFADNLSLWIQLMKSLRGTPDSKKVIHELVQTALQESTYDIQRAMTIDRALTIIDMDDSGERDWIAARLIPYRNDENQPETCARIRIAEVCTALRTGQPVDLETAFGKLKTTQFQQAILQIKLRHYLNTSNLAALKTVIGSLQSGDLVHPAMLSYTIPALDALGMKQEAALARTAAKREMYRAILSSWENADFAMARHAVALANAIGDTPLPSEWLAALAKTQNMEDSIWVRVQEARAKRDWPTVAELAAKATELPSNTTDYYWYQAEALYKIGKKTEAIPPLETFVARAMQSSDYLEARRLLQSLGAAVSSGK